MVVAMPLALQRRHHFVETDGTVAILRAMDAARCSDYVFPGWKSGKPLSNMAMSAVLDRMKVTDVTVHGFRSTFRDWCAERTAYANEVVEKALAHAIRNEVEAAYRRGDLLDKRRQLLNSWETYCSFPQPARGEIIGLRAG